MSQATSQDVKSQPPEVDFAPPPPHAPPYLTRDQLFHLAKQGWLPITLSPHLKSQLSLLEVHAASLFDLSSHEKLNLYPQSHGTELGYYRVPDEKEYLTLRHSIHPSSDLEGIARQVWKGVAALLHRILVDLARGMNWPENCWDGLLDGCLGLPERREHMTPTLLRLFRYYPDQGFAGDHTDLGLLTLCVGNGKGLQVRDWLRTCDTGPEVHGGGKRWVDAAGAVVLAGDALRIMSTGKVRSGSHRVVENQTGRTSAVFALRPSLRHVLDGELFGREKGEKIDPKILWKDAKGDRVNVNATKEIRSQQEETRKKAREGEASGT